MSLTGRPRPAIDRQGPGTETGGPMGARGGACVGAVRPGPPPRCPVWPRRRPPRTRTGRRPASRPGHPPAAMSVLRPGRARRPLD